MQQVRAIKGLRTSKPWLYIRNIFNIFCIFLQKKINKEIFNSFSCGCDCIFFYDDSLSNSYDNHRFV
jgi:hypothetical protein